MTRLTKFMADTTDRLAADLEVVQHDRNGHGRGIGIAADVIKEDLLKMEVGPPQGEDSSRGAYQWWPLMVDGKQVAELRDDANGLTIHTGV